MPAFLEYSAYGFLAGRRQTNRPHNSTIRNVDVLLVRDMLIERNNTWTSQYVHVSLVFHNTPSFIT